MYMTVCSWYSDVLLLLSWENYAHNLLGGCFEEFSALDRRMGFVLGGENWDRGNFKALLSLVKSLVLSVWDARKE